MSFFTKRNRSYKYYLRKAHRYLGVILGVQFLFWTAGGLYFSWSDIDKIHGDHLIKAQPVLRGNISLVSPEIVLKAIKNKDELDSLSSIRLINILQQPVYQVHYYSGKNEKVVLADAGTGMLREPLSKEEAIRIAGSYFLPDAGVEKVEYLEATGKHHEYRGKPLPAWAVSYNYPGNPVLYIAASEGTFQNIRYRDWRIFDFLWMFHTMDYQERDRFGNILLRTFSVFALVTVISGFVLYFISYRRKKKEK
ncbi:MAG: hypothetical protein GXO86_06685 [Chlorobi bacterium]|nr:hypothetical protein [Chlorobiota bacterium]